MLKTSNLCHVRKFQCVFHQQKINFGHLYEFKTLISTIVPWTLFIYQVKKTGNASIPEGSPIRINTIW